MTELERARMKAGRWGSVLLQNHAEDEMMRQKAEAKLEAGVERGQVK